MVGVVLLGVLFLVTVPCLVEGNQERAEEGIHREFIFFVWYVDFNVRNHIIIYDEQLRSFVFIVKYNFAFNYHPSL